MTIFVLNGKTYNAPADLIGEDYFGYSDLTEAGTGDIVPLAIAMLLDGVAEAAKTRTAVSSTSKNGGLSGSQNWVLTTDVLFPVGSYVTLARTSAPDTVNYFGQVTAYNSGTKTLTVSIIASNGAGGPYTDWTLGISGPQGPSAGALPAADTTPIVKGSADATKLFRFEVDGQTTATTRVATTSNYDGIMRLEAIGSDVASASTVNLDTATGDCVTVTGTTTITAVTLAEGKEATVRFAGVLTLTNGASLVLPTASNITTAAGDYAIFRGYSAGVVRCVAYLRASGAPLAAAPTRQVLTSGTGATYTTPSRCRKIRIRMRGGDGGGGGTGSSGANNGGAGGDTLFNSIEADGGDGGSASNGAAGGAGGAGGSSGAGSADIRIDGTAGSRGLVVNASFAPAAEGEGGVNPLGGKGGRGGAASGTTIGNGGGGGAGEYVEFEINNPSASYTYTVGAAGTAGSAGTGGNAGLAGRAGLIIVDEFY